ncbi:hypothetical protein V2J09_008083 [Rumex salicifolius]
MEQCSPLGWVYCGQQEGIGDLKRFLVQTTMELEVTVMSAQDEISRKEEEIAHMRDVLMVAIKERDEAQYKCQELLHDKVSLQQQLQSMQMQQKNTSFSRIMNNNEETNKGKSVKVLAGDANAASFSSDSDDSIISEPVNPQLATPSSSSALPPNIAETLGKQRALPEKGKLLQAVMEAGPTLQTLLLAGPLPQWQHPPPQLDTIEIPPVTIPTSPAVNVMLIHQENSSNHSNKRRSLDAIDGSVSSVHTSLKYQRLV